jgi:hypothetical protein
VQKPAIALAFTANGKKITLLNAYERSRSRSMHAPGFLESEFGALYLFVGGHYKKSIPLKARSEPNRAVVEAAKIVCCQRIFMGFRNNENLSRKKHTMHGNYT